MKKDHIKKIKARRKRISRIRNNHLAGTIVTLFLLVLLACTATGVFATSFLTDNLTEIHESDTDMMYRIRTLYANADFDPESMDIFGAFDTRDRPHFIRDADGKNLLIKGKDTCDISEKEFAELVRRQTILGKSGLKRDKDGRIVREDEKNGRINISVHSSDEEYEEIEDDELIIVSPVMSDVEFFPDTEGDYFGIGRSGTLDDDIGMSISIITALKVKYGLNILRFFSDERTGDETYTFPYWMATQISEDGKMLFVRTEFTVTSRQLELCCAMLLVMSTIMILMVTLMLINMISSLITKRMLANAYFADIITKGHNLNWFDLMCDKYLCSNKNSRIRCAVLNIAFANYRSLSLSHSADEAEKMLSDVYREISRFFGGKKSCCAHCTTSNFAAVTNAENDAELNSKLLFLLTELENISKEHNYIFHIGVAYAEPELSPSGKPVKREVSDVLTLYNNACTARETLDESDESGIAFFDDKLIEEQQWINTVNEEQQTALQNEEFQVYYQPKYDPRTDRLRGAEALIRWQSPKYGFVTPNRMIPIFEKNGFITEIDHYMITHAARDQRRWLDMGLNCVPVSVNVSRAHFIEEDLAEQIRDAVDNEGTPHELIEIELTESAFFDDKKAMISTITRLKEYGFTVSMDDFGAGYSSLNSLKDMPLDVLKLDAEFFRGSSSDGRGEIVVAEAIKLAKSLNMHTVAEGVEIKEQVDFLAGQGCDMIQGYFYSKPVTGGEFEKKMIQGVADIPGGDDPGTAPRERDASAKPADDTDSGEEKKESAAIVSAD